MSTPRILPLSVVLVAIGSSASAQQLVRGDGHLSKSPPERYAFDATSGQVLCQPSQGPFLSPDRAKAWFLMTDARNDYFLEMFGEEGPEPCLLKVSRRGHVSRRTIPTSGFIGTIEGLFLVFLGPDEPTPERREGGLLLYNLRSGQVRHLFNHLTIDQESLRVTGRVLEMEGVDGFGNTQRLRHRF